MCGYHGLVSTAAVPNALKPERTPDASLRNLAEAEQRTAYSGPLRFLTGDDLALLLSFFELLAKWEERGGRGS